MLFQLSYVRLRDRREDIEPNLRYELEQFTRKQGVKVTFNKEAEERFLRFATSPEALWPGNFRDLNAAVTRMATLSAGGRITLAIVEEEIARLLSQSAEPRDDDREELLERHLAPERLAEIDPFDRVQLSEVIRACESSRTLSDAGRVLFSASRKKKVSTNDADRLRKYLARFGLDWKKFRE